MGDASTSTPSSSHAKSVRLSPWSPSMAKRRRAASRVFASRPASGSSKSSASQATAPPAQAKLKPASVAPWSRPRCWRKQNASGPGRNAGAPAASRKATTPSNRSGNSDAMRAADWTTDRSSSRSRAYALAAASPTARPAARFSARSRGRLRFQYLATGSTRRRASRTGTSAAQPLAASLRPRQTQASRAIISGSMGSRHKLMGSSSSAPASRLWAPAPICGLF
mmetsp:Transcript_16558/g.53931  ORF Transcript_16558/g.53931 Transcript_16558/m.53931 type:complete len:224 (-) Transcript_16558:704-1375(-)